MVFVFKIELPSMQARFSRLTPFLAPLTKKQNHIHRFFSCPFLAV